MRDTPGYIWAQEHDGLVSSSIREKPLQSEVGLRSAARRRLSSRPRAQGLERRVTAPGPLQGSPWGCGGAQSRPISPSPPAQACM